MENELVKRTRNVLRWLMRKMDDEIFIRTTSDHKFFKDLKKRGLEVGVLNINNDLVYLTSMERLNGNSPRHKGRCSY